MESGVLISLLGIVGAIGAIAFIVFFFRAMWERGIGARGYLILVTVVVVALCFYGWNIASADLLNLVVGILFSLFFSGIVALLGWAFFSDLGLVGKGGFFEELTSGMRNAKSGSADRPSGKLPDLEVKVGDILAFGHLNGKQYGGHDGQPIYWRVLDMQGDQAFLVAEQYVRNMQYQSDVNNIGVLSANPWGGLNDIQPWLNHDFLDSAFDSDERARLVQNSEYDFVSLLSVYEATRFFSSESERRIGYIYAHRQAVLEELKKEYEGLSDDGGVMDKIRVAKRKKEIEHSIAHENENGGYWLRPSGLLLMQKRIPYVASDGSIQREGKHAGGYLYVRPTILISTRSK